MTVYVDDMRRVARVGQVKARWSHLVADTSSELHAFATRLGLRPEWVQHQGTHREHYDVTDRLRTRALELGAVPVDYPRGLAELVRRKAPPRTAGLVDGPSLTRRCQPDR